MIQELQDFGLSEKEAKVYFASLEIGRATANQLARHSGINRSTTYTLIETLSQKGLMGTYDEGKKTYFIPESPKHLWRIFETRHQEIHAQEKRFKKTIPTLTKLFEGAGDKPAIRFFEGKEGLVTIRNEILKMKSKHMSVVVAHDYFSKIFSERELKDFVAKRIAKKIKTKMIYTKDNGEVDTPGPLTEFRQIPSNLFPLKSDMYIFDNTVVLSSLEGGVIGVIIESESIARSMLSVFSLAWEASEKHSKKFK